MAYIKKTTKGAELVPRLDARIRTRLSAGLHGSYAIQEPTADGRNAALREDVAGGNEDVLDRPTALFEASLERADPVQGIARHSPSFQGRPPTPAVQTAVPWEVQ